MPKELNGYVFPDSLPDAEVIEQYRRFIKEDYLHMRARYQRMIGLSNDQLAPQITQWPNPEETIVCYPPPPA